jgi:hypothetical protein
LYLRRVRFQDGDHYIIRKSFRDDGCWKYSDLMDLGWNPETFIEYTGGNGFCFSAALEEKLQAGGAEYSSEDLEQLFLPFLNSNIRRIIENFQAHGTRRNRWGGYSEGELLQKQGQLHLFDKRRMHFLRCGRIDIGNLEGRPWKFLNILLEKSRDEIEHTIEGMENVLRPHEMRSYIFTALQLQAYFPHHLLRNHPLALDPEKVDECFLDALCCLNKDTEFFAGVDCHDGASLHPHLSKYLILYFDSDFGHNGWPEYLEEFLRWKQSHRSIPAARRMDVSAACKVLGMSREEAAGLERKDLVRLYRKKAKEHHPDRGGDKECFIQMTEAFACLLEQK